jgi:hypothetical protein
VIEIRREPGLEVTHPMADSSQRDAFDYLLRDELIHGRGNRPDKVSQYSAAGV